MILNNEAEPCRQAYQKHFEETLKSSNSLEQAVACASMLHVPKKDMANILSKLGACLKTGGVLYTSYKYGEGELMRGGRLFADYTEESFELLLEEVPGLVVVKFWKTSDLRTGREYEKWLNILLKKGSGAF
jgi:hypothetical protein